MLAVMLAVGKNMPGTSRKVPEMAAHSGRVRSALFEKRRKLNETRDAERIGPKAGITRPAQRLKLYVHQPS
jgi:hypothetical protein